MPGELHVFTKRLHSISTHSAPPTDHSPPDPDPAVAAVSHSAHTRPGLPDTSPAKSDCSLAVAAAAAGPAAVEAARTLGARFGPIAAVAAAVAGPRAGAVAAVLEEERRTVDVRAERWDCTGAEPGCKTDSFDVDAEVDRTVGRIRGEGEEVGMSSMAYRCRIAAGT